jgi:outer membrane autotransporter protein
MFLLPKSSLKEKRNSTTLKGLIRSLKGRMNAIRSDRMTSGYDQQAKSNLIAYADSDGGLDQLFAAGRLSPAEAKNDLWLNGFGQWGDQEGDSGFTGFDYTVWGTTLGFDHIFADKFLAGLSLGYSRTDIDLDDSGGDGDIDSLFGSLYGSYFNKNAYIEAAFSYGRNWYDNQRSIQVGPDQRKASSDHDGDAFSGYLGAGYYFNLKDWSLGPFGTLRYVYLDEESFQETGAGGVSLEVDGRNTDSLVSELGLQVMRSFETKYGSLIPELSAAWSYDFDIDDRVITTSFAGSPGAEFSIEGQEVNKNGAVLTAGLTFIHKSGFSTSLDYIGEFRQDYQSNGVIGVLRYSF